MKDFYGFVYFRICYVMFGPWILWQPPTSLNIDNLHYAGGFSGPYVIRVVILGLGFLEQGTDFGFLGLLSLI